MRALTRILASESVSTRRRRHLEKPTARTIGVSIKLVFAESVDLASQWAEYNRLADKLKRIAGERSIAIVRPVSPPYQPKGLAMLMVPNPQDIWLALAAAGFIELLRQVYKQLRILQRNEGRQGKIREIKLKAGDCEISVKDCPPQRAVRLISYVLGKAPSKRSTRRPDKLAYSAIYRWHKRNNDKVHLKAPTKRYARDYLNLVSKLPTPEVATPKDILATAHHVGAGLMEWSFYEKDCRGFTMGEYAMVIVREFEDA